MEKSVERRTVYQSMRGQSFGPFYLLAFLVAFIPRTYTDLILFMTLQFRWPGSANDANGGEL